ncbi:MAG: glycoside hydrolase family 2 TIM barrel-domain containing protein [Bacteroidales bacterium]
MSGKLILILSLIILAYSGCRTGDRRTVISLNGTWKIAEGSLNSVPDSFWRDVPVPGLVSLAEPPFIDPGPKVRDRRSLVQKDSLREAFWYYRTFDVNVSLPEHALLKVSKAIFGTRVILNGKVIGEHLPCFTPGWFDLNGAIREGRNEIYIRVGASRGDLPAGIPDGFDFEKDRYIPGIFDKVEIVLNGSPAIRNVQAVPVLSTNSVLASVTLIPSSRSGSSTIVYVVREAVSNKKVGMVQRDYTFSGIPGKDTVVAATIPVSGCRLWSPEDPFLYKLIVMTDGDEYETRFGMREFKTDTLNGRTLLNGRPYYMRGSNITLYRFFEDDSCRDLPWDSTWVRKLHKSFKQFHWNSLRYCIGLAPEEWYNIADEEGIMIQDEFPVWYGGTGWNTWPEALTTDELAKEYREWMMERWNHPSVVIWDASNETVSDDGKTEKVAEAVKIVRHLDLSGRPWDNSYSKVRETGDVIELHPYHFQDPAFRLQDISKSDINPGGPPGDVKHIKIVNEYGWLWLNRDGSPTTLTSELYGNLLGKKSTTEERRALYSSYMAAETEFWRCNRQCAAVLHFTALGYSRKDGQTSDNLVNISGLQYDADFMKYMTDAFSPVALMLDEWGNEIKAGKDHDFRVVAINDLEQIWKGRVAVSISDTGGLIMEKSDSLELGPYGREVKILNLPAPGKPGIYTVTATLDKVDGRSVHSVRKIQFK